MRLGAALATIGVAVSVGVMALAGHYLLGLPWELAILLGAVTSPTDAAAVFSVLRVVPLPKRLQGALEAESGLNDAPTVVLVTLVSTGAFEENGVLGASALIVLRARRRRRDRAGGRLRRRLADATRRAARPPASTRWPCSRSASCRTAPRPALHASGFAAVYVAALVLGNQELPHRAATRSFAEGVAWLAQIGLFVMLGLLLSPGPDHSRQRRHRDRSPASCSPSSPDRCRWSRSSVVRPDAAGASCRSSRGPACAAPSRSCWPRSRSARASTARSGSSTSSSSWSSSTRC